MALTVFNQTLALSAHCESRRQQISVVIGPCVNSSRSKCLLTVANGWRIKIHMQSLTLRRLQQQEKVRVRCSSFADPSTADPPWDSPMPTLYELLEIPQHVGLPEIKVAYRQMARRYHPDVCPPTEREECTRRFLQVQEAYDTLSDPHLRADYDIWLQNPLNTRTMAAGLRAGSNRRTGMRPDAASSAQWKEHWELQLHGLQGRSAKRESWAARMRKRKESD